MDKVTSELLNRIKNYERELELLREENRDLVKASSDIKHSEEEQEELKKDAQQS